MTGERITKIIAAHFHVEEDQVSRGVKFDAQFDCDETDIAEIASHLEDEFDIAISDDEADARLTVGNVIDFVVEATKC